MKFIVEPKNNTEYTSTYPTGCGIECSQDCCTGVGTHKPPCMEEGEPGCPYWDQCAAFGECGSQWHGCTPVLNQYCGG